jgi:hypothetical protein
MSLGGRDRIDPVALDLAKGIGFGPSRCGVADESSLRWHYPVQVHAVGACRALSAQTPELPLAADLTRI